MIRLLTLGPCRRRRRIVTAPLAHLLALEPDLSDIGPGHAIGLNAGGDRVAKVLAVEVS